MTVSEYDRGAKAGGTLSRFNTSWKHLSLQQPNLSSDLPILELTTDKNIAGHDRSLSTYARENGVHPL